MDEAVNDSSTVPCRKCGYQVPVGGMVLLEPVIFPDESDRLTMFWTSSSPVAHCPQCGIGLPDVKAIYSFLFLPGKEAYIQIPHGMTEQLVAELSNNIRKTLPGGWEIVRCKSLNELRLKTLQAVGRLVNIFPTINDIDTGNLPQPLSPTGSRDLNYHAALDIFGRKERGAISVLHLPNGTSENETWRILENARIKQVKESFFEMCKGLINTQFDPLEQSKALFVSQLLDAETVSALAELVDYVSKGKTVFYIDACLAGVATHGEVLNPRASQWANAVVASFLDPDSFSLELPPERWQLILTVEDLFEALDRAHLLEGSNIVIGLGIAREIGWSDLVSYRLEPRLKFEINGINKIQYFEGFIKKCENSPHYDNDDFLSSALNYLTYVNDSNAAQEFSELAIEKYINQRPIAIVPMVRRVCKRLTDEGVPDRALQLLKIVEENLTRINLDENVLKTVRSNFANERGNAYRQKLGYDKAREAYRQALEYVDTKLDNFNYRVIIGNLARVDRDSGNLAAAIKAFEEIIPYSNGMERFDYLFALAIALQRAGHWEYAFNRLLVARTLVEGTPLNDQLASFWQAYVTLARKVEREDLVVNVPNIFDSEGGLSDRSYLLNMLRGADFYLTSRAEQDTEEIRINLQKMLSDAHQDDAWKDDARFSLYWARCLNHLGEFTRAERILSGIVDRSKDPLISMHAACTAAEIASKLEDWHSAEHMIAEANKYMLKLVSVSVGEGEVNIVDTMNVVRNLAGLLSNAPDNSSVSSLCASVADLQNSLALSVDIAAGFLPALKGSLWQHFTMPENQKMKFLQFMDAGSVQVPLVGDFDAGKLRITRGRNLNTEIVVNLGRRIAGRINRLPGNAYRDVLDEIKEYKKFKDFFNPLVQELGITEKDNLMIAVSPLMNGIPLHHILKENSISYVPSISIGLSLVEDVTRSRIPETIGEVICARYDESKILKDALDYGAVKLEDICNQHRISYRTLKDLNAVKSRVESLLSQINWLKLSCHGVADQDSGRFAFVLSDGKQLPPGLQDLLQNDQLAQRYLYEWEEVASSTNKSDLVFSTACTSGRLAFTTGREQIGIARSFLVSGVAAYVAPLWPVPGDLSQLFINTLVEDWLGTPTNSLPEQLYESRKKLSNRLPDWVAYAFVIHGYYASLTLGEEEW